VKATFQIPDDLYREVKAETARDGNTLREVVIHLFEQWLRQKKQLSPIATTVDWQSFQPPLAHLLPGSVTDHSTDAMRESIARHWNEQP
jgi:hypothetical protein